MAQIRENKSKIVYDNVTIKGDLFVSNWDLPKENEKYVVEPEIEIKNSRFDGTVGFERVHFKNPVIIKNTLFSKNAFFSESIFYGAAVFSGSQFNGYTYINRSRFKGYAYFDKSEFGMYVDFSKSKFFANAYFRGAHFDGEAVFGETQFKNVLEFRDATFGDVTFKDPKIQENVCRMIKNYSEKNGDRDEAGYYFYREMEAKRRQKPRYIRYPEFFFIQLIFGYGVHPFRLMFCWFLVAVIFAISYSVNGGIIGKLPASSLPQSLSYFIECFYFSIVTAVTPGYGKYELTSWVYQVIASIEAIFGTFMWAAFIATFARKYMR